MLNYWEFIYLCWWLAKGMCDRYKKTHTRMGLIEREDNERYSVSVSSADGVNNGQPPSCFHLLTILQNSSAVRSVSYNAECASLLSKGISAV